MSSKLKLKSNAGGSVSLAVDDTLTTDEEVTVPSDGQWGIESGDLMLMVVIQSSLMVL